jgi:hypothetical protein
MLADGIDAIRAGTFGAHDCHQSRLTMPVDEQGRREAMEVANDALERFVEIQKECAQRLALPSEEAVPMAVFMLAFETATGAERKRPSGGARRGRA